MHEDDRDQPVDVEGPYMEREPRASLENEVVERLRGRGELGAVRRQTRSWALQAAAAVVLFLSGWGAAQLGPEGVEPIGPVAEAEVGQRYMLLLWEGPEFRADPGVAEEYGSWGGAVAESGVSISGDELAPIRQLFGPVDGDSTSVGPNDASPASDYRVGGYFMIGAGEEQAAALAQSHPHRRNGGWVEVAPVVMR